MFFPFCYSDITSAIDVPFDTMVRYGPAYLMASDAPPSPPEETWKKHFGNLIHISSRNFIGLGMRIRQEVLGTTTTTRTRVIEKTAGTFNLECIIGLDNSRMVIRIPACGRSGSLTRPAEEWLQSHVRTLKYVREHTTIPVPEVYHFDTTSRNEISAPYIAMSYIEGGRIADLWFDGNGPTPLEKRRRRILEHLAQLMAQLHVHRFDKIGSLVPNHPFAPDDDLRLGPCFGWDHSDGGLMAINSSPPFQSSKAWLRNYWAPLSKTHEETTLADGTYKLLRTMLSMIPDQTSDFKLAPDQFDWQNVMADEEGNITALVNWDNAQTTPDVLGCLRYPAWIVVERGGRDNGPDKLREYRAYYLEKMKAALAEQDPERAGDYKYTANSNAVEAFWIAFTNPKAQVNMCEQFVAAAKDWMGGESALPPGLRETPFRIIEILGADGLNSEEKTALAKGLKALMGY